MFVGQTQYLAGQPGKKRRHCTTLITLGKYIREPPDHTGNEPALDIHIGGSGQDLKNKMADTRHV